MNIYMYSYHHHRATQVRVLRRGDASAEASALPPTSITTLASIL